MSFLRSALHTVPAGIFDAAEPFSRQSLQTIRNALASRKVDQSLVSSMPSTAGTAATILPLCNVDINHATVPAIILTVRGQSLRDHRGEVR